MHECRRDEKNLLLKLIARLSKSFRRDDDVDLAWRVTASVAVVSILAGELIRDQRPEVRHESGFWRIRGQAKQ
ncbi:MAG TPA: hypothetical protein DCK99_21910 [Blastocatellia bacterium]|nr:hypothetical protein [Blastocatellia bacterium]